MGVEGISTAAHEAVVLMDTTYWGRNFGVVILMDASTSHVLWFKFIDRKERLDDYREGLAYLKKSGISVRAVVSDGFTGLREMLSGTPYQLCQFHQLQRIRQLLTNNALESLNSVIKTKLRNHRGISTKRRMALLANLLRLYKPDKQRRNT